MQRYRRKCLKIRMSRLLACILILACMMPVLGSVIAAADSYSSQMDRLFCSACGKQIPVGSKFCMYCGHTVAAAALVGDPGVPGAQQELTLPTHVRSRCEQCL